MILFAVTQMPSGHGQTKASSFWLVDFKGEPVPNKRKNKAPLGWGNAWLARIGGLAL